MPTIYAQLVSTRTKQEYMEIVEYLNKKKVKFDLSINVYHKQEVNIKMDKGQPYYRVKLWDDKDKDYEVLGKNGQELMEKLEIFMLASGK